MIDHVPDLADLVQEFRMLCWKSSRSLRDAIGKKCWRLLADAWFEEPESLLPVADALDATRPDLAAEWRFLAAAFAADPPPRRPPTEELLARYRNGDLEERTIRYIEGWDPWDIIEARQKHRDSLMKEGDDE